MWKTHWGLILNSDCRVSVDIMELIWKTVRRFDDWICFFFGTQTWCTKRSDFSYTKNLSGKTEHLLCNWESPHWKLPKFFKGKWFYLNPFLVFVQMLPAKCYTKCYASYQYSYTNACFAMVQKHILKIWDDSVVKKRLSLRASTLI
jgi:hypothetical protein